MKPVHGKCAEVGAVCIGRENTSDAGSPPASRCYCLTRLVNLCRLAKAWKIAILRTSGPRAINPEPAGRSERSRELTPRPEPSDGGAVWTQGRCVLFGLDIRLQRTCCVVFVFFLLAFHKMDAVRQRCYRVGL